MSAPSFPDPTKTAGTQLGFAEQAAKYMSGLNQISQRTPTGSLTYSQHGTNADGSPRYVATSALNPAQRGLLNAQTGEQRAGAGAASSIIGANAGNWAAGPNMDETGITKSLMGWGQQYMQPIFDQQNASQDAKLQNQGIMPGSEAYTRAHMDTARNQNDAYTQLLMQGQGQAMQAAQQKYTDPLQAIATLSGGSQPQLNYAQTPQSNVQTPDYSGLVGQQYQAQQQQYGNMMSGLFSIPSTLLGGWASGGFR